MEDLTILENWVEPLLQQITPPARKHLAKQIGTKLRQSQQQRIKDQKNLDCTRFLSRRSQQIKGVIKCKAMFIKLKREIYLKIKAHTNKVNDGFYGRVVQLARVHQKELRDKPHRNSRDIRYKKRKLSGFSVKDKDIISDGLLLNLAT